MDLPEIDIANLPGLDTATGLFGSLSDAMAHSDDRIIVLMVWFYDLVPPATLG